MNQNSSDTKTHRTARLQITPYSVVLAIALSTAAWAPLAAFGDPAIPADPTPDLPVSDEAVLPADTPLPAGDDDSDPTTADCNLNGVPDGQESLPIASRIYVDWSASGDNDGRDWANALTDLQAALCFARGDYGIEEIWVAQGTYRPDGGTGNRDLSFQLVNGVAVYGGFAGFESSLEQRDVAANTTILSGDLAGDDQGTNGSADNAYHVVTALAADPSAVLDGFVVTSGRATGADAARERGGGLYARFGSPTISHCVFSNNRAIFGGGLHLQNDSDPRIDDCAFAGNRASFGGGAFVFLDSDPVFTSCVLSDNRSGRGGAVFCQSNCRSVFQDCDFDGNSAALQGGGAETMLSSAAWFERCAFRHNESAFGGAALFQSNSDATLIGCVVAGNTAQIDGGGVFTWTGSDVAFVGCTFEGNRAMDDGGGLRNLFSDSLVVNCLFTANVASGPGHSGGGAIFNYGANTQILNSTVVNNVAEELAGGVLNEGVASSLVANSIMRDNADGQIVDNGNNVSTTVIYSNVEGGWTGPGQAGNVDLDPLFRGPPVDYRLSVGSPMIDAGDNLSVPADAFDLDGDGDLIEPVPIDLDGAARFLDDPASPDTGNPQTADALVDMGAYEFRGDCNSNGVADDADVAEGTSTDCDLNGVPDECDFNGEPANDCNDNGVFDPCDLTAGTSTDCNADTIPDECELEGNDCDADGVPDECENDCNSNGRPDDCDLLLGFSFDCNSNGRPDECEIERGSAAPGGPFFCEVGCNPDCNHNGVPDDCDIAAGSSTDCNFNAAPDECDIAAGSSDDVDGDDVPDECTYWVSTVGLWSNPQLWDDLIVPDNTPSDVFYVTIDRAGADVTLDIDAEIQTLSLGGLSRLDLSMGDLTIQSEHGMLVDGELLVGANHALKAAASFAILGARQIRLQGGGAAISSVQPGNLITLMAGARGVGVIDASLVNLGTVSADNAGVLSIRGGNKVNNGLFEAVGGATLEIDDLAVTGSGDYRAFGGALRLGAGSGFASVAGRTLTIDDSSVVEINSPWVIQLEGTLAIGQDSVFDSAPTITGRLAAAGIEVRGGELNLGASTTTATSALDVFGGTTSMTASTSAVIGGTIRVGESSVDSQLLGFTPPVLQISDSSSVSAGSAAVAGDGTLEMSGAARADFSGGVSVGGAAAISGQLGFTPPVLALRDNASMTSSSLDVSDGGYVTLAGSADADVEGAVTLQSAAAVGVQTGFTPPVLSVEAGATLDTDSIDVRGGNATFTGFATTNVAGAASVGSASAGNLALGFTPPVLSISADATLNSGSVDVTEDGTLTLTDSGDMQVTGGVSVGVTASLDAAVGFTPPVLQSTGDGNVDADSLLVTDGGNVEIGGSVSMKIAGSIQVSGNSADIIDRGFTPPVLSLADDSSSTSGSVAVTGGGSAELLGNATLLSAGDATIGSVAAVVDSATGVLLSRLTLSDSAQLAVEGRFDVFNDAQILAGKFTGFRLSGDFIHRITSASQFNLELARVTMDSTNGVGQALEVAGANRGQFDPSGFVDNYALGILEITTNAIVNVVDSFDNQQDGSVTCDEALYVDHLIVRNGALLDSPDCRVYYRTLSNAGGSIPQLGLNVLPIGAGDLDGDNTIGTADYAILVSAMSTCIGDEAFLPEADLDGDGCVTLLDYQLWLLLYREFVGDPQANPPYAITADFDGDGDVDLRDYAALQRCVDASASDAVLCTALFDVNNDGVVDSRDCTGFTEMLHGPR